VPRRGSPTLTDGELRLMRVLWGRDRATVGEVTAALPGEPKLAYNTVLTMLKILERKKYVRHWKQGRAFAFYPVVDAQQARRTAMLYLVSRFFDDSPGLLVLHVLQHGVLSAEERDRVRVLLNGARPDAG